MKQKNPKKKYVCNSRKWEKAKGVLLFLQTTVVYVLKISMSSVSDFNDEEKMS